MFSRDCLSTPREVITYNKLLALKDHLSNTNFMPCTWQHFSINCEQIRCWFGHLQSAKMIQFKIKKKKNFNFLHQLKGEKKSSLTHRHFTWQVTGRPISINFKWKADLARTRKGIKWGKKSPCGPLTAPSCLLSAIIHQGSQRTSQPAEPWLELYQMRVF